MRHAKEFTVQQAAQRLGVTLRYVRDLLYEGKFAGAKKAGRTWTIPVSSVEARLKAREQAR